MLSWLAGRVALPRPVALGTLGVRVIVERMVLRGTVEVEGGERLAVGLSNVEVEDRGRAAEEAGVDTGELRLEEEGEDLLVPLA